MCYSVIVMVKRIDMEFVLPCGHNKHWIGFNVFDVVRGRVVCFVCAILGSEVADGC